MYKPDIENPKKIPHTNQPSHEHSSAIPNSQPENKRVVDNSLKLRPTEFSGHYAEQQEETLEDQMMTMAKAKIDEKAGDLVSSLLESFELDLLTLNTVESRCRLRRNLLANHRNFSYLPKDFKEFFVFTKRNTALIVEKARSQLQNTFENFLKNIDLIETLIEVNYLHEIVGTSQLVVTNNKEAFTKDLTILLTAKELSSSDCQEISHWFTTATLDLIFLTAINKKLIRKCQDVTIELLKRINLKLSEISVLKPYANNPDGEQMVAYLRFGKKNRVDISKAVNRMLDLAKKEQTIIEKLQSVTYECNSFSKIRLP